MDAKLSLADKCVPSCNWKRGKKIYQGSNMIDVKVTIRHKDRKIGAMVKALAVEVSGFLSVKGTTKEFLNDHGFYIFHFPSKTKAEEFKKSVLEYVDSRFATIDE
jgi:hypothetical protein